MSFTSDNITAKSALPMLDMIIRMQRIGLQAMSVYQPLASAFLNSADSARKATWAA